MAHIQDRRKSGRGWVARYTAPDGRERSKAFRRKIDAERWLTQQEGRKLSGKWVDPGAGRITFGEWAAKWWATTTDLRDSSRARDESYLNNHVLPRFEHMLLNRITQEEVRAWVADLVASGLAPATVRLIYAVLSRPMQAAVDARRIAQSPCRNIPLPRIEQTEMRFLTAHEVETLASEIPTHYRALVLVAAYLGPRWGEATGLHPDRLDLLHRKIHIVNQLTEVKGTLTLGAPLKTASARRTVTLPRFLVPILEEHLGSVAINDLVFPSPKGKPLRRTNFRRRVWLPAVSRAGLEGVRFHDLRHTAVAFAIDQGAHPKAIQERMGHASITTTLDRYGHLFPQLDEQVAEGLDRLYAETQFIPEEPLTTLLSSS